MRATKTALIEALSDPDRTDSARLAESAMSRRCVMGNGAAFGVSAFVMGALAPLSARAGSRLRFEPVAASTLDTVTVL